MIEKTARDWIVNKKDFYGKLVSGWTKCMISYDDIQSFAGERLIAKVSKKGNSLNNFKDGLLCYFEAEKEALLTESGVKEIKYQQLEVQATPDVIGDIEAWYEYMY